MLTNAGKDFIAAQIGSTSPGGNGANFIGLTANAAAPAAGDTALTGEIATAGGGLVRAQATYAHTTGTSTYTLTKTFTANANDVLPVDVAKAAAFTAAAAGTMMLETLLAPVARLAAVGDNVTITDTVTVS